MDNFTIIEAENRYIVRLDITGDYMFSANKLKVAERIISALEKQIPIKQTVDWVGIEHCPVCKRQTEWNEEYCRICGQKLNKYRAK